LRNFESYQSPEVSESFKKDNSNTNIIEFEKESHRYSTTLENHSKGLKQLRYSTNENEQLLGNKNFTKGETYDSNTQKTQKEIENSYVLSLRNKKHPKSISQRSIKHKQNIFLKQQDRNNVTFKVNDNSIFKNDYVSERKSNQSKRRSLLRESCSDSKRNSYFLKNRHSLGNYYPNGMIPKNTVKRRSEVKCASKSKENWGVKNPGFGSFQKQKSFYGSKKRRNLMRLVNTSQKRFIDRMQRKYNSNFSGELEISLNRKNIGSIQKSQFKNSFNIKFEIA
jgi:hypothetical protein